MAAWKNEVSSMVGHPLRAKQEEIFGLLLEKKSVFGVLTTGYGKSLLFGGFPTAYESIHPDEKASVLIVSPLNALMSDQNKTWNKKGIASVILRPIKEMPKATLKAVKEGEFKLMFVSPETVQQREWWKIIKSLRHKIKLLCFDEAHLITRWSEFRKEYLRSLELRGIICKAPVLALTATATKKMVSVTATGLGLEDMVTVAVTPDRPEIFLKIVGASKDFDESLEWYAERLLKEKENCPKAIIYGITMNEVIDIFFYLNGRLGPEKVKDGAFHCPNSRFVEMFHGKSDKETQERVVTNFREADSTLRCVVATIAFGVGVNIPNVRYVLHWGPPEDAMAYWQQIGRCARDGENGEAIAYIYPWSRNSKRNDECILDVIESRKDISVCLRAKVLSYMAVSEDPPLPQSPEKCCCNCVARLQRTAST